MTLAQAVSHIQLRHDWSNSWFAVSGLAGPQTGRRNSTWTALSTWPCALAGWARHWRLFRAIDEQQWTTEHSFILVVTANTMTCLVAQSKNVRSTRSATSFAVNQLHNRHVIHTAGQSRRVDDTVAEILLFYRLWRLVESQKSLLKAASH